jgi:hypothetical protein
VAVALRAGVLALGLALAALITGRLLEATAPGPHFFWAAWGVGAFAALLLLLSGMGYQKASARWIRPAERATTPRLGEILVDELRVTSVNALERALADPESRGRPLGAVAVAKGLITPEERDLALDRQLRYRDHAGSHR